MALCERFTCVECLTVRKFGRNKTIGALKVRGKVAEISFEGKFLRKAMKSQEICRNSLALLLHNTVPTVFWEIFKTKNTSFGCSSTTFGQSLLMMF